MIESRANDCMSYDRFAALPIFTARRCASPVCATALCLSFCVSQAVVLAKLSSRKTRTQVHIRVEKCTSANVACYFNCRIENRRT